MNCTNCRFTLFCRFVFRFILRLILWLVLRLRVGGNIVALCVQTTCFGQGYVRQDVLEKETNVLKQISSKFPAYLWEDHIEDIIINFFVKEASLRNAAWFAKLTTHKHCSILENRTCLLWDFHILQHQSEKETLTITWKNVNFPPAMFLVTSPFCSFTTCPSVQGIIGKNKS